MGTVTHLGNERLLRKAAAMRRPGLAERAAGLGQDLARLAQDGGAEPDDLLALADVAFGLARRLREGGDA